MKLIKAFGVLFVLVLAACSAQSNYSGDNLASYINKDSVFKIKGKQHHTYYDLVNSVTMIASRRGIKDSPSENPVVIDSYVVQFGCVINEKRVGGQINITANIDSDFYNDLDIGSSLDGTSLLERIGDNYTAEIEIRKSKKDFEKITLKDLEDSNLIEYIEKTIQGSGYSPLPEDDVCIDHVTLAELLYNNRGGRNNERLLSYQYVIFDEED